MFLFLPLIGATTTDTVNESCFRQSWVSKGEQRDDDDGEHIMESSRSKTDEVVTKKTGNLLRSQQNSEQFLRCPFHLESIFHTFFLVSLGRATAETCRRTNTKSTFFTALRVKDFVDKVQWLMTTTLKTLSVVALNIDKFNRWLLRFNIAYEQMSPLSSSSCFVSEINLWACLSGQRVTVRFCACIVELIY